MENLESKYPNLYAEMRIIASEFIAEYRNILSARSLSKTGDLADTIYSEIISDEHALNMVISLAGYWIFVERGRGPGKQPPIDKIERWVEFSGLSIQPDENGNMPSVRSVAFMIARKIGREGTQGKHIVNDIIIQNIDSWIERIQRAGTKDVAIQVREILSKLTKK